MSSSTPSRGLHIGLWVVQVLLALPFFGAGVWKSTGAIADLGAALPWVPDVPVALVRFIGVSELLGAIGLILPSALRIQPKLTALAAALLGVVMILAFGMHAMRGEVEGLLPNVMLGGLAFFVAWGRAVAAPIAPKA